MQCDLEIILIKFGVVKMSQKTKMEQTEDSYLWKSNGKENYSIEKIENNKRGTAIKLYIKKDADEFLDALRLRSIITKYSNYIPFPIILDDLDNTKEKNFLMKKINSQCFSVIFQTSMKLLS